MLTKTFTNVILFIIIFNHFILNTVIYLRFYNLIEFHCSFKSIQLHIINLKLSFYSIFYLKSY